MTERDDTDPSALIDATIADADDWRGGRLAQLRGWIHEAVADVVEEVKWRKPSNPNGVPTWNHHGIICTGEIYKDKVKLTFARGASLPDPDALFNSSLDGKVRRAIDIHEKRRARRGRLQGPHPRRRRAGRARLIPSARRAPPIAAVVSFIDCINRGDLDGLTELMTDDHALVVLDEAPLVGRRQNRQAWDGYFASFPDYVMYPRHIAADGHSVAVLGTTTGSHLGLPDDQETKLGVVWLAQVVDGRLSLWRVAEDSLELRDEVGIPATA